MTRAQERCHFFLVFVPKRHISWISRTEGLEGADDLRRLLIRHDPILQRTMLTLSMCASSPHEECGRADEAARRLVLRLAELNGGGTPDWNDDESVFDNRTLPHVVEYIDAHLKIAPSLSDMGLRLGLSPSHFAKKFRQSVGLSFCRFVNRRRIAAALHMLKDRSEPLAHLALELGFSSQAHFTQLFRGLTGMTPAKYRKQFRPAVG